MAQSWRVFAFPAQHDFFVVALASDFREQDGQIHRPVLEALQEGKIYFALEPSLETALDWVDVAIADQDRIHILTGDFEGNAEHSLHGKRLLKIARESLRQEYERLSKITAQLSADFSAACEIQAASVRRIHGSSDRAILRYLRKANIRPTVRDRAFELFSDRENFAALSKKAMERPSLLLHVCCGPDAGGVIQQLKNDYALTCFWYDPNIQPAEEHARRLDAFRKVASIEKIPFIEGEYDVDRFFESIRGLEHTPEQGAKCSNCYDMRLERSAQEALRGNFDYYATTLAISPHKVQEKLIKFGALNERRYGVPYYHRNFMRADGFKDSVEYSRENEIYRQDYCGCIFSLKDGGADARQRAESRLHG